MDNIDKLRQSDIPQVKLFADTITSLSRSQGLYGRLCNSVNEMSTYKLNKLIDTLKTKEFIDSIDVVLWIES